MTTVTTVRRRPSTEGAPPSDDAADHRRRLLDALAASIAADGYRGTTVADIVRRARTSRRTFYEHFADKEACFAALLTESHNETVRRITAAVDPQAPWETQIRQAVETWIATEEADAPVTLSWIRDVPSLGEQAQCLHRENMETFIKLVQDLGESDPMRAAGIGPIPRHRAIILLGGLRELVATTLESGGRPTDLTEIAMESAVALLHPIPHK